MSGEIKYFRKRFFGGFNRQDVIDYISKLAKERNQYLAEKEKAEQDNSALSEELSMLRLEVEALRREAEAAVREAGFARQEADDARQEADDYRALRAAALENAEAAFAEFEAGYKDLCMDIRSVSERACADIEKTLETIATLPAILEKTGERIEAMRAAHNADMLAISGGDITVSVGIVEDETEL